MDWLKSQNQCLNTVLFPGRLATSSYSFQTYKNHYDLKLLYVPFKQKLCTNFSYFTAAPSHIPVILAVNNKSTTNLFCIHFHGNACDIGQIAVCARLEAAAYNCHYLLVEYPGYGLCPGHPNEVVMNEVARIVHDFVIHELRVHYSRVVLVGRSIGTGPACALASHLQTRHMPPFALILQSPFVSIHAVASDLLGLISYCMFDRWPNWYHLVGDPRTSPHIIQCPVLFIHADHDQIISCHHSRILHEQRLKYGLKSELFIQQSTETFRKGHNFFDYDKDVLVPCRQFLVQVEKANSSSTSASTPAVGGVTGKPTSTSTASSTGSVHMILIVPQELYTPFLPVPQAIRDYFPPPPPPTLLTSSEDDPNNTKERMLPPNNNTVSSSSAAASATAAAMASAAQEGNGIINKMQVNKARWDICIGWSCCPCVVCAEGCLGGGGNCLYFTCIQGLQSCGVCPNTFFYYEQLRPSHFEPGSVTELLFRKQDFVKRVNEMDAFESKNARSSNANSNATRNSNVRGSASSHNSSNNNNDTIQEVKNPLIYESNRKSSSTHISTTTTSAGTTGTGAGTGVTVIQPTILPASTKSNTSEKSNPDNTEYAIRYVPG